MLVVSVGTGTSPDARHGLEPEAMTLLFNATTIPSALMFAALNEQDLLCRVFGDCRAGDVIDREIGDLIGSAGPLRRHEKLFTYLRYNAELTREGLDALGLPRYRDRFRPKARFDRRHPRFAESGKTGRGDQGLGAPFRGVHAELRLKGARFRNASDESHSIYKEP